MESLRTAVVQLCSTHDRTSNIERAVRYIRDAAVDGAKLIVLPENFVYIDREGRKIDVVESIDDGPGCRAVRDAAARFGVTVAAGSVPLDSGEEGKVFNSLLVWAPDGSLRARYDKIHLFDIELDAEHSFRESRYVRAGEVVVTTDVEGWRLGLSICYDLRFPELYRALVGRGAQVLLVPAAFTARTGRDHWELMLRARAVENQCWVVAAAQWGRHNPSRESWGHSMIVDPWGTVCTRLEHGEGFVAFDLDRSRLDEVRTAIPCLQHRRIGSPVQVATRDA